MSQCLLPRDEDDLTKSAAGRAKEQGHSCEQCGARINAHDSLVCRNCGWYASIGSFVEIDHAWENVETAATPEEAPLKMPVWGWTMIVCVTLVVAESIAARFLTEGALRTTWSLTQLFVGFTLAAICHFTAFVMLMRENSDSGFLDIILKPIKPWGLRLHELPSCQWLCHVGISSVVAVVMALAVIGGIPYEKLLDWGFAKPVKKDLIGAIASQAQARDDKSLEEAVQELAGKHKLSDKEAKPSKKAKPTEEPKERGQDDCVIIGYRPTSEGIVYQLLLAGENLGKLQYVGQVTPQLSVKQLRELTEQLSQYKAHEPFVQMAADENVVWVKPNFACRVSYARKGEKGGLFDIKLESMLGEIAAAPVSESGEEEKKSEE